MNALILTLMLWLPQYTVTFRNPHSDQSVTLLKAQCTAPALLAALEEADREFVNDLNERHYGIVVTLAIYTEDRRTEADKLRDAAKELERKSATAKRIRETIAVCKKSVVVAPDKK